METTSTGPASELAQELSRFISDCKTAGSLLAIAANDLSCLNLIPSPGLLENIRQLQDFRQSLIERSFSIQRQLGVQLSEGPHLEDGLQSLVHFVEGVIALEAKQSSEVASVLDLLAKASRLIVTDGDDLPALASVRSRASELTRQISELPSPVDSQDYVDLSGGTHPFCYLVRLVEADNVSDEVWEEGLIEVASLDKILARAVRSHRLTIRDGQATSAASLSLDSTQPDEFQANEPVITIESVFIESSEVQPQESPAHSTKSTADSGATAQPKISPVKPGAEAVADQASKLGITGREARKVARRPTFRQKSSADRPTTVKPPVSEKSRLLQFRDLLRPTNEGSDRLNVRMIPNVAEGLSKDFTSQPAAAPMIEVERIVSPIATEHLILLPGNFPAELQTFDAFRVNYWINSEGQCEVAPWTRPEFASELKYRATDSLSHPGRLLIFNRAATALGLTPLYANEDVQSLTALLIAPFRPDAGKDPKRSLRLADSIRDGILEDNPAWKLAVTLEAFRPSGEFLLGPDRPEILVSYAGFRHDPLRKILKELLVMTGRGVERPLETIGFALHAEATPSPAERMTQIQSRQVEFRGLFSRQYSAGGRLKTSHSREAWSEFMREGKLFFESLFFDANTNSLPDAGVVATKTDYLWKRYEMIADRGGVKYQDRHRMDRMVEQILNAAEEIGELIGRARADAEAKKTTIDPALLVAIHNLTNGEQPDDHTERGCLNLLLRLLGENFPTGERRVMDLTVGELAESPGLVSLVPLAAAAEIVTGAAAADPVCGYDEVTDALVASALLMAHPSAGPPDELSGRRLSVALQDQPERLVRLRRILSESQRAAARRDIERQRDEAQERVNGLKLAHNTMDALVSRWTDAVGRVYSDGQKLVDDPATEELALALGWLDRCLKAVNARIELEVTQLNERITGSLQGEPADRARRAINEVRYGDALQILGDPNSETREDGRRLRETSYRKQAQERFPNPRQAIKDSVDQATQELRASWQSGIKGGDDRRFRNDFLRFLCSQRGKRKASATLESAARFDNPDCRLPTHAIRERISEFGLNPCYLPQLIDFEELIILVPPTQVKAPNFVKATAGEVARRGQDALCVVLAPNVTQMARDALLKEFRDRRRVAAVIDDLDFCRLLNPGGEAPDPLVGFFEILLEQQRWESLSPYSGRLVGKEMFVGRSDEAGNLKRTDKYSRLFSGRKLGKTSLLNHVLQTTSNDAERLPSGNILRVLLITSVGPDARQVVDEIRDHLATRLDFQPNLPVEEDPGDALEALAAAFVTQRPKESLLVIIDEADSFFEKELELYETKLERGLSFRMSREVERKHLDSKGLPRIRFLFSGYRVTNKSEGVWANWGDVLRLTPLEPQDADNLAAGPLARMGIDLGHQTRVVSSRCGYQPAVLLRFGKELLAHLDRSQPHARREHVTVSAEDVAQVLHRDSVKEEIRTVVRYNFIPGNRLGELVFEALLLEFHGSPPAAGITETSKRLLDRLRAIDPDTSWLLNREASAESEIERQITDFVERQLLTEHHEGIDKVRTHRLKFPHHLAVLCPNEADSDRKLREGIAVLRTNRQVESSVSAGIRSLFSPKVMDDLRYVITRGEDPDEPARAAIVSSHWLGAITHRSFGVPILLGLEAESTIRAYHRSDSSQLLTRRLAVLDADPQTVMQILRDREPSLCRPLFTGGADLMRWAIQQARRDADGMDLVHYGLGRMSPTSLEWWFSRVRRLGFPTGPDPFGELHDATGGIPLLVRDFDKILLDRGFGAENSSKEDVSRDDFQQALSTLQDHLKALARELREGSPASRLEPREIQILAMVARVVREGGERCTAEDLRFGLTEGWEEFYREQDPSLASEVDESNDQNALALLQSLGLLPFAANRSASYPLGRLEPPRIDDPIFHLVDLLNGETSP